MQRKSVGTAPVKKHDVDPRDWLAAMIEGSEDAIISKDLSGYIQSWNPGAARLFGYDPGEVIGRPITILIPEDRLAEEPSILAEIKSGRRVEHFETMRRRKDGSLVHLSLTISPIRATDGTIVGASKIARDISERRQSEERQRILMAEMQHRVKNLFAVAAAIVSIAARSETAENLAPSVHAKLSALARAHELTMANWRGADGSLGGSNLFDLIQTVLEPYRVDERIRIEGDRVPISGQATTDIALLIYEMATNSAKYGALSVPEGRLFVIIRNDTTGTRIDWAEHGGPSPKSTPTLGFGSQLERSLALSLNATISRDWRKSGLIASIDIPGAVLAEQAT